MDLRKRYGEENALEVVKEHLKESEQLYTEVLENSRNHHYVHKPYGTSKMGGHIWNSLRIQSEQGSLAHSIGKPSRDSSVSKGR